MFSSSPPAILYNCKVSNASVGLPRFTCRRTFARWWRISADVEHQHDEQQPATAQGEQEPTVGPGTPRSQERHGQAHAQEKEPQALDLGDLVHHEEPATCA